MIDKQQIVKFIKTALAEDVGWGDITTLSTVPEGTVISGRFVAKSQGVLCGTDIAKAVFGYIDPAVQVSFL